MCGIAGFYGTGSREILEKMTDVVSYRGPDDRGVYLHAHVGLGHRRLSIIDTSPGGHQPLGSKDGDVRIVFNGEIYNHRFLRTLLKGTYAFQGASDTEVIVYLFKERGIEAFTLLEGMFAFALYDARADKLFLVRDRMGEKPLYWAQVGSTLLFGSEQKSILEHPAYTKDLNIAAVHTYLSFEYVPTPHSLFAGIQKLPPASALSFDGSKVEMWSYWDLQKTFETSLKEPVSFDEAKKGLDTVFSQAVEGCLVSDVPVGVFLSGGIDSSAIAYYAQKYSATPIETFSIGFHEPSFDESSYARTVATHLGTTHHEKIFAINDLIDSVEQVVGTMDEPLADPSLLPTFLLSRFAREHVTVALGGDGGDELLCGYDTFRAEKYARLFHHMPAFLQHMSMSVVQKLPTSFNNMSLDFKLKKFMDGFDGDPRYRHQRWLGAFSDADKKKLLSNDMWHAVGARNTYADTDVYFKTPGDTEASSMADIQALYQRTYLLDDILTKVDRASMQASLEVRAPFLNHHVVEYLNGLPTEYKLHNGTTKYLLKKLLEDALPASIVGRKKKGFGIPLASWLHNELRPLSRELLGREAVERRGLFNHHYVQQLLDEHEAKRVDHRKKIWTLMVLELWFRAWMPSYRFS